MNIQKKIITFFAWITLMCVAVQSPQKSCEWCHKHLASPVSVALDSAKINCTKIDCSVYPTEHFISFPQKHNDQFYGFTFVPSQGDCCQKEVHFIAYCSYDTAGEVIITFFARCDNASDWFQLETIKDTWHETTPYFLMVSLKCDGALVLKNPSQTGQKMYFLGKPLNQ